MELVSKSMTCIDDQTPLRTRLELVQAAGDLHRRAGNFSLAIENSKEYLRGEFEGLASYEDLLVRDYRLSAALYDAHRFEEAKQLLAPWIEKVETDAKIVSLESKPKLFNSLARVLAALGETGWRELFEKSIEIQKSLKNPDISRTRNYLVKWLLKDSLLGDAEKEINKALKSELDKNSSDHLEFLQADLARRRQQVYPKHEPEVQKVAEHAKAFFYQAYARQPHPRDKSRDILKIAGESLLAGLDNDSMSIRSFLGNCCHFAAAVYDRDKSQVEKALGAIEKFIAKPECSFLNERYINELNAAKQDPSVGSMNKLFDRIPHF